MTLNGKKALVTGAGRGIGRSIALRLAREGAVVLATARTQKELQSLRKELEQIEGSCLIFPADLTRASDVRKLIAFIHKQWNSLDILVNNAGIGIFKPLAELSIDDFDSMWSLNVRAIFMLTQGTLPLLRRSEAGQIVNISSLAGKNFFVGGSGYAATKWALNGLSKCLMLEERKHNIRTIVICPGSVDTTFARVDSKNQRKQSILIPDDVAETVMAAVKLPPNAMISELEIRPTNPGS